MDTLNLINKYYPSDSPVYSTLLEHSRLVVKKCIEIAEAVSFLSPDIQFIKEAAMLHDIGIIFTKAPAIGCYGEKDYICHGYIGRELLEKEGLPAHALVCERHVGVGLSISEVKLHNLPIPVRDMLPFTLEEKIICYADKFFSKDSPGLEKTLEQVRKETGKYGAEMLKRLDEMTAMFSP
jgi:uncharacterized protein